MSGPRGYVYLLHLEGRINPDHPCRHYLGFTLDLRERIAQHRTGGAAAARLLQVAKERGIGFTVARVWKGDRGLERRIKRQKHTPAYCPVCGGHRRLDLADELPPAELERLAAPPLFPAVFPVAFLAIGQSGAPLPLNGLSLLGLLFIGLAVAIALIQLIRAIKGGAPPMD